MVLRQCAELYRQLIKVQITPAMADDLELWQIAALMERSASEVAEDPDELNRRIIAERYRAAADGRELDARELFAGTDESGINRVAPPTQK